MKPYQQIPIRDCGEPLVAIPPERVALIQPHPYQQLGAPYAGRSPFYLRQGVLASLLQAQATLAQRQPGWQIQVFDAYRPIAVQQFMVDYTLDQVIQSRGLTSEGLTPELRQELEAEVYQFWAVPSADPATPPPHSTGAAIDVTLVDGAGLPVDMGSAIDEISPRSYPNYFADQTGGLERQYHQHRQLLAQVMAEAGFYRHPNEWWHFSQGDQMATWLSRQETGQESIARYGAV